VIRDREAMTGIVTGPAPGGYLISRWIPRQIDASKRKTKLLIWLRSRYDPIRNRRGGGYVAGAAVPADWRYRLAEPLGYPRRVPAGSMLGHQAGKKAPSMWREKNRASFPGGLLHP
jgi:hypothetical protein